MICVLMFFFFMCMENSSSNREHFRSGVNHFHLSHFSLKLVLNFWMSFLILNFELWVVRAWLMWLSIYMWWRFIILLPLCSAHWDTNLLSLTKSTVTFCWLMLTFVSIKAAKFEFAAIGRKYTMWRWNQRGKASLCVQRDLDSFNLIL